MSEGQLALPLPYVPALRAADFLPHDGARLALDMIAGQTPWPQHRLVLWGGPGAGKTHLLHVWAGDNRASIVAGPALLEPFWPEGPVAIDDADRVPSEEALLARAERGGGIRASGSADGRAAAGAQLVPCAGSCEPDAGQHGHRTRPAG